WKVFEDRQDMEFILGNRDVIWGLEEALYTMKKGEQAKVVIKSPYGFEGDTGKGARFVDISPTETIHYFVEVLEFDEVQFHFGFLPPELFFFNNSCQIPST